MRHLARVLPLLIAAGAIAAAVAGASSSRSAVGCPHGALPLGRNAIGPAADVAIARERRADVPVVEAAARANADRDRGPSITGQCGEGVRRRTVVVYITLEAYAHGTHGHIRSSSLAERIDYVSRFSGGYRVWEVAH
jgi:hypothetical protein